MVPAVYADFLKKASDKHGIRYNYDMAETGWKNGYASYLTIVCSVHGPFIQQASVHAHKGHGCIKCNIKPWTTEQFVERAMKVHGQKWDYSKTCYVGSQVKVEIGCPKHGYFWQVPDSHLGQKTGCPKCGAHRIGRAFARSHADFLTLAHNVHADLYDYSQAVYNHQYERVPIICKRHGMFHQQPKLHLKGSGCPTCGMERGHQVAVQKSAQTFEARAKALHGDKYSYSQVHYTGNRNHVTICCPKHGEFQVKPEKHLDGQGCPTCSTRHSYSEKACDWLDHMAASEGIQIQHARNNEEFSISGTNYKADGYCAETGTVYEFYG